MGCGFDEAVFPGTRTEPDFDVSVLPPSIRDDFTERLDGICLKCGLYQEFRRFTPEQLEEFRRVVSSKDLTTEGPIRDYPVPDEIIAEHDTKAFAKRIGKWRAFFLGIGFAPRKCLFLRPTFGAAPIFVQHEYGSEI